MPGGAVRRIEDPPRHNLRGFAMERIVRGLWSVAALCLLSGCVAPMNHTQSGTLGGAGLGAVAGAIVGQAVGAPGAGAAIGAATGAVTGNLVGQAEDIREERDFAWAQADAANAQAVADARALTEGDVVTMVQSGVGDAVIIQAVASRGCRWEGTPQAIIRLKQQGVSDGVLNAMQRAPLRGSVVREVVMPGPVYVTPPPPGGVVLLGPPPPPPRYCPPPYGPPRYRGGPGW